MFRSSSSCVVLVAAAAVVTFVKPCTADPNYDMESMWANRRKVQEFSIGPAPFPDHSQMAWELYGSAYARDNCIEVTKAEPHLKGAVWSRKQNTQYSNEFQAEFNFRVGGGPEEANRFGDGFALWYIDARGVGGTALGGPEFWTGVGIFFDTCESCALAQLLLCFGCCVMLGSVFWLVDCLLAGRLFAGLLVGWSFR
jgi:hypothetical protein